MATTSAKSAPPKGSFAKVAAYDTTHSAPPAALASRTSSIDVGETPLATDASLSSLRPDPHSAPSAGRGQSESGGRGPGASHDLQPIDDAVKALRIKDEVLSSTSKSSEDGATHVSASESSSRRPPSFDCKSATSGMTFALDEKESLRPDDSASVMAAEEDDASSAPGSIAAGSRVGSETGARAFRDQFHEISERMGYPPHRGPAGARLAPLAEPTASQAANLAQKDDAAGQAVPTSVNDPAGNGLPFGFTQSGPDEKLLEALESPKDRLFLLRLEQDVIEFVKDSKEPMLDLPPCNSFCRLLIHKLADYYFLTHFVDTTAGSVRVYRTPFCRLPPPLTGISNPPTSGNTPPPSGQAMKIMRRGMSSKERMDGDLGKGHEGGSQTTSEDGGERMGEDGKVSRSSGEASTGKDKSSMTREEREIAYREARERIFKGFQELEGDDADKASEDQKERSRSSSTNDKSKSKKQRSFKDDGFEARSQFAAYYPPTQFPIQTYPNAAQYGSYAPQPVDIGGGSAGPNSVGGPSPYTPTFPQAMQPQAMPFVPPQSQLFPSGAGGSQIPQPGYGQGALLPRSPNVQHMHAQSSYPTMSPVLYPGSFAPHPLHASPQPDPQWSQPLYQSPYHAQPPQQAQQAPHANGAGIPYAYGQLPAPAYSQHRQQRKHQHPIPGSFSRNAFNPQTQSFVPGGGPGTTYGPTPYGMNVMPAAVGQYGNVPGPFMTPPQGPSQGFGSPHSPHADSSKQSPNMQSGGAPTYQHAAGKQQPPSQPHQRQQQGPLQSSLAKWGTPPTLPPKPPAPSASSQAYAAAVKASLPQNGAHVAGLPGQMPIAAGQR
ncbi:MAG: hypothetical protein M1832_003004 [Thelocarpon impressellum]|nr:MAG: hypothetical protein M1832_003004 [Thelocarpon impressellum]